MNKRQFYDSAQWPGVGPSSDYSCLQMIVPCPGTGDVFDGTPGVRPDFDLVVVCVVVPDP